MTAAGEAGPPSGQRTTRSRSASRREPGPTLVLPGQLRPLAGGVAALRPAGRPGTVRDVLTWLRTEHPAVHARLVTEQGELRPHLNLFVEGRDVRRDRGLDTPLESDAEILVLLSVSGG